MGSILSQDEVNALLKGVVTGEIETETKKEDIKGTRSYDFSSQDRIVRGRMPTLEIITERFSRSLSANLSLAVGKHVDITISSNKTTKFSEFMKGVPVPASFNILKLGNLRGHIMLLLDPNLVFMLVDMFFGGNGQTHVKVEGRDFTFIEQRIIKKVMEMARVEMEKAWNPVMPLELTHVRSEVNPQFAQIVQPIEVVIIVNFKVEAENFSGTISLCLPYSTLEPIKDKLFAGFQAEQLEVDKQWVARLREMLGMTSMEMVAELGKSELKVRELANLKPGDVLILNTDIDDELKFNVEGVTKFMGRPGMFNSKPALKITKVMNGRGKDA